MRKTKNRLKKIPALLMAFLLAFSGSALQLSSTFIYGADQMTVTFMYEAGTYDGARFGMYSIESDGVTYQAYCFEAETTSPAAGIGTESTITVSVYVCTDDYVRASLYFGYGGPEEIDGMTEFGTHQVVSYYFSGETTVSLNGTKGTSSGAAALYEYVEEHVSEVPESFTVYYCYPAGTSYQVIGWWEYEPEEEPEYGWINLSKESAADEITASNTCYSLEGATYTVYSDADCTQKAVTYDGDSASFTVGADGQSQELKMETGTYYVKETASGTGYTLDETVYKVTVEAQKTIWVNGNSSSGSVSDEPVMDTLSLLLIKKCDENSEAPLSGAVYKISFYESSEISQSPSRIWYLKADDEGCICLEDSYLADGYESDDFYYDSDGNSALPLGSFSVQEVEAPLGYLLDDEIYTAVVIEDEDAASGALINWDLASSERLTAANTAAQQYAVHYESMSRSDLTLYKTNADGSGMAYIPFLITRTWTDEDGNEQSESQILVTDENGYFSSADRSKSPDNVNVLSADEYVNGDSFTGTDQELEEAASYNIWFGDSEDANDSSGSLLYGEYTVTELRCSANKGKTLITKTFSVSGNVSSENSASDETAIIYVSMVNFDVEISTEALNSLTETKTVFADSQVSACDIVTLKNLVSSVTYKLYVDFVDEDGQSVGSAWSQEFSVEETLDEISISVYVTLDLSSYSDGGTITALAYLYQEINGSFYEIAAHADMSDEDEQLLIASIKTTAMDSKTMDHVGSISESAAIIDTVYYENLSAGENYVLVAELVDEDGNIYATAQQTFCIYADTAANRLLGRNLSSGEIEMELEVDSTALAGMVLYVNESLYWISDSSGEMVILIAHESASVKDEDQCICYPDISTSATDYYTQSHVGAASMSASIVDCVSFSNLLCGRTYILKGSLYDQETAASLLVGGQQVSKEIVIEVLSDGTVNLSDEDESISFTYDEETESISGEVTLTFEKIDASLLGGTTAVVYERLYLSVSDEEGVLIAGHTELFDENQTIHYPALTTAASDADTGDNTGSIWGSLINKLKSLLMGSSETKEEDDEKLQTITDAVSIENLIPGQTYTLYGILVEKETLEEIIAGGDEISAGVTFTISKDGSSVTVTGGDAKRIEITDYFEDENCVNLEIEFDFTFDSSTLAEGIQIVVFENLYSNGVWVASHADPEDESQTVNEIGISTVAADANTKDHVGSAGETISIIDTVSFTALTPGDEYLVVGRLVNQGESTSEALSYLTDANGEDIIESVTFTADPEDENFIYDAGLSGLTGTGGSIELEFEFECPEISGLVVSVITEVYHNGVLISVHGYSLDSEGNLTFDPEESIYYMSGGTTAADADTSTGMSDAKSEVTITDLVYFENLVAGEEYTVSGAIHYARDFIDASGNFHSAGDTITFEDEDGNIVEVTSEITFVAAQEITGGSDIVLTTLSDGRQVLSGYITLEFTLDCRLLEGATIVVFEDFIHEGAVIYTHADINDALQSIQIPAVSTTAYIEEDLKEISAGVYYEETDEYEWNTITITDTVTFENLLTQQDLESLKEEAFISGFTDEESLNEEVYATYAVSGYLVDGQTGEIICTSAGEMVSAYTVFSPEASGGQVSVVFTLDLNDFLNEDGSCSLEGRTLVVYEDLYYINKEEGKVTAEDFTAPNHIAQHKDTEDEAQAVLITEKEVHSVPETSDESNLPLWISIGFTAFCILLCSAGLRFIRKRNI